MMPTVIKNASVQHLFIATVICLSASPVTFAQDKSKTEVSAEEQSFDKQVAPLLKQLCVRCHNADKRTSGIRVDDLNGKLEDRQLFRWKDILHQIEDEAMPPEDEPQPSAEQRKLMVNWIRNGMNVARSRNAQKNGSVRRLTVSQYRNTLRDLLGIDDNFTDVLPPDAVSKDGFLNNGQTMQLSPLLIEAYFNIAEKALDAAIVDVDKKPVIENFRMDFGKSVNPKPFPDRLILGANSHLLANQDFMVTQLDAKKPFDFTPFRMRTKYRFIEGYQGNATVRGWRDYDSIYHAVFACMRGNNGYPIGRPYELYPAGMLLRPAIPSAELFGVESTYGPKVNFKISLRELPDNGRFRVTVKAAKYNDGLLLDGSAKPQEEADGAVIAKQLPQPQEVSIERPGIYQVDVYQAVPKAGEPDGSKLADGLIANWSLDGNTTGKGQKELEGKLNGGAKFVNSPFGGKAVHFDGTGSVTVPRDDVMNVGSGEFTVSAWIRPTELRQAGIFCLGRYNYTHGWYFDMPSGNGVLRIETMNPANQLNGKVQSKPGAIRVNRWQHVAAVVQRGENKTRLYVNGIEVAVGTINDANLDNPTTTLHIGRIEGSQLFKGDIDEVRFYRRALGPAEISALLQPGLKFVSPPSFERDKFLNLELGDRQFSGKLSQTGFLAVRLPAGPLKVATRYEGTADIDRIVLTPLADTDEVAQRFAVFDSRAPHLGVHVGLRRDCGSTLAPVGQPQNVSSDKLATYVFEDAIGNYPSPDVEQDNVNYLAGVREIGVRSEFTDGRDMPRLLIRSVEFEGPLYDSWPPATHANIFIESQHGNTSPEYAREVIRRFASRAFRRPITDEEEASLVAVFESSFTETRNYQLSLRDALLVTLTSPQFLFLIESSETPKAEPINSHELASKLSYFLWNTAPDQRLLDLAAADKLQAALDSEVERMIADTRFEQFTSEFATQWLNLDKFDVVEIDRKRFPKLTRDAKTQLRQEPVQYLQHAIRKNLPVQSLIRSDFIIANEIVANYYDMANRTERGFEFVAIKHDNPNLGGLLANAGIMSGLSDGRESNPVKRGAWLARKIIAEPPADPPPNVPELKEETKHLSLRERLFAHRNQPGCAKCHKGIDPWGVPFEQIDAGGLFKTAKVDARSTLPDETEVADLAELKSYLANDRIDQVTFSVLKHLGIYATGRSLTYNEMEFLKENISGMKDEDFRLQNLVKFIVTSPIFLEK